MMANRNKKGLKSIDFIYLILIGFSMFAAGCSQNSNTIVQTITKDSLLPPSITHLSQLDTNRKPTVILLKNTPKPAVIAVPSNYYHNNTIQQQVTPSPLALNQNSALISGEQAQGKGTFTTFTTDDGLALDQVLCSYKDKKGYLWFGTNGGGVSKYDGENFTNYTSEKGLANNIVWCIAEDNAGNMWFGTDGGGVSKFDGERFTNFTSAQGLPSNVIFSICIDKKGNLWIGTAKGGVSKFYKNTFTNYTTKNGLASNTVKSIVEDKKGNIWFATLGGGVSKFNGKTFTNFTSDNGLATNTIWSMTEDAKGNLWFGTEKGVSKFDGVNFTNLNSTNGLSDNFVLSIQNDTQGNIWFGTLKGGVSKFDGKYFINYSEAQGLSNTSVRSITEDVKGNLWFCTYGGGISKYEGNGFTNFTTEQGLANNIIYSIAEDNAGHIWLGTSGGGVSRYDGKNFINYSKLQGLADNVVYAIANDKNGNLWFGTSGGGVSKFDGKKFTNYTIQQGLANNIIFSILEDKMGNIWFGTSGGGVSKFDGESFTNYTAMQGLANNVVFSMLQDDEGDLWFGTLGGGISKFDGETFSNFSVEQGLANRVVWSIKQEKSGDLMFATQQGISIMRKKTKDQISTNDSSINKTTRRWFETISEKDGLPDNFITQVVAGKEDKLYIGTNFGLCELNPLPASKNIQKKWSVGKIFNTQTGYPVKDVNAGLGAMFSDSKGIIWIGTGSDKTGLVRFNPKVTKSTTQQPTPVYIKSIKINNEKICWSDLDEKVIREKIDSNAVSPIITEEENTYGRLLTETERDSLRSKFGKITFKGISKWNPIPQKLVLPYNFNSIDFEFNAIETGKNFRVQYQYMLKGYDREWSPPDYKSSVNFGHIFEGTYTFFLKAKSPEGVWSEPIAYTFKILPPWWRTWWMYITYSLLLISTILFLFWWNNRLIIAKKNKLENEVRIATIQLKEENEKVNAQKKKIEETLQELKETQSQLIQAEKMASLGELTAGIAHEIQNPLNFVNNFSEVSNELMDEMNAEIEKGYLKEAREIAMDIKQNLEKINQHGKRADAIVKGMLQHSRSSKAVKEPTNINKLADEYLRLAYHGLRAKDKSFNATMKTEFDDSIGNLNIIQQDIGRVILNLITNAFYVVNEKNAMGIKDYEPTVTVKTAKVPSATTGRAGIEISVEDNGNGIPQKVLDKIFQPFFTTKPSGKGTGLGLSLSYDIVKVHGGELKVESTEGKGAVFTIVL